DLADVRSGVARSRERDEVDARMLYQVIAEIAAGPEHEVEHALWKAGFLEDLDEPHRQHRRVRRGLEDDGVAEDERGHDLPGRDREREVPGRDRGDDAVRVAHAHGPLARQFGGNDIAELAAAFAGDVIGHVDALLDIAFGFR